MSAASRKDPIEIRAGEIPARRGGGVSRSAVESGGAGPARIASAAAGDPGDRDLGAARRSRSLWPAELGRFRRCASGRGGAEEEEEELEVSQVGTGRGGGRLGQAAAHPLARRCSGRG